jgi:hypothetical protein
MTTTTHSHKVWTNKGGHVTNIQKGATPELLSINNFQLRDVGHHAQHRYGTLISPHRSANHQEGHCRTNRENP